MSARVLWLGIGQDKLPRGLAPEVRHANGKLFDVDQVNDWEFRDGKLFVFFTASALGLWQADRVGLGARAEPNWPRLNV